VIHGTCSARYICFFGLLSLPPFVVPDVYGRGALLKITSGGGIPSSKSVMLIGICPVVMLFVQFRNMHTISQQLLTLSFKHVVQPKWYRLWT
jgi:hypothetical protein